jgi:hypothetical protein
MKGIAGGTSGSLGKKSKGACDELRLVGADENMIGGGGMTEGWNGWGLFWLIGWKGGGDG